MKLSALARATGAFLVLTFAVVGIALAAFAVLARTDGGGVTRVAGHPVMTVLSDSMTPMFKAGDLVVGSPVGERAGKLPVGTVITFHANNLLVTHRIVRTVQLPDGGVGYRTQGDANNVVDAMLVKPDQVAGVYSWHVPYAGSVLDEVQTPKGITSLVIALALFLLMPGFARKWRTAGDDSAAEVREEVPDPVRVS
jgi:signal peptidase I